MEAWDLKLFTPYDVFASTLTPGVLFLAFGARGHAQVGDERFVEGPGNRGNPATLKWPDPVAVLVGRSDPLDRIFSSGELSHHSLLHTQPREDHSNRASKEVAQERRVGSGNRTPPGPRNPGAFFSLWQEWQESPLLSI